ncbi:MAG: hypothetical protein ABSB91_04945 [Sedimentisphaerales bacterium]
MESACLGVVKDVAGCYLLGSVMKAEGIRGRGEGVLQMLVSRIPLAEYAKPSKYCAAPTSFFP